MALSTVSLWLKRIGLGKRSRLEPPEPPNRYERRQPGELVHVDIKKLGRIRAAGHRVTAARGGYSARTASTGCCAAWPAGSSCTSASTTTPDSPTSKYWAMSTRPPRSASCAARSTGFASAASRSSG